MPPPRLTARLRLVASPRAGVAILAAPLVTAVPATADARNAASATSPTTSLDLELSRRDLGLASPARSNRNVRP